MQSAALVFALTATLASACAAAPATVTAAIPWPAVIAAQDPVWNRMPTTYFEGPFVGNGLLGAIVYLDPERPNTLRFELGRTDVYDHAAPAGHACRLPIGQLLLTSVGKITATHLRTDLWNGEITGTLTTEAGSITLHCLAPTGTELLVVTTTATGREGAATWALRPEPGMNPRVKIRGNDAYKNFTYVPNPPFQLSRKDGFELVVQPLLDGSDYATAWRDTQNAAGTRTVLVTVANRWGANQRGANHPAVAGSGEDAIATLRAVTTAGLAAVAKSHRAWWHGFYTSSFVSVPDPRVESFYWQQLYKLASATRPDLPPIDLMGPWYKESIWAAYWTNLNTPLNYYLFNVTNHADFNEPQSRLIEARTADLIGNVPKDFQSDSAALGNPTIYGSLRAGVAIGPGIASSFIALPWYMQQFYQHVRHAGDDARLKASVFPMLVRTTNTYLHVLALGADGRYHLPLAYSDEYGNAEDTNLNLALIRWCLRTLIEVNDRLALAHPLRPRWQEVLEKLVDYQVDPATGLMIGKDTPLAKSHRHSSHLFAIYPFHVLNLDEQPLAKPLIEQSIRHFTGLVGDECLYKFSAASSLWSSIGNGEESLQWLQRSLTIVPNRTVTPNTLYAEGRYQTFESPISIARSITDMLLQSWGGVIRVFPSMPGEWQDAAFHDLRTEGAFLISARRHQGKTLFVRVKSLAGEPCRLRCDLPAPVRIAGRADVLTPDAAGVLHVTVAKGEEVVLFSGAKPPSLVISPLPQAAAPSWGLP